VRRPELNFRLTLNFRPDGGSHEGKGRSAESGSRPFVDSQALLTGKAQETAGLAQIVENGAKTEASPPAAWNGARTG
jgi:hypothetical protein